MAVLAGVSVSVADDVGIGVGDGQMIVHPLLVFDSVVDRVLVGTENDATVAVLSDVFVSVFQILADEKSNSSVGSSDRISLAI